MSKSKMITKNEQEKTDMLLKTRSSRENLT